MAIKLVLAEKQPLILFALEMLLSKEPDFEVLAQCCNADDFLLAVRQHRPDVLVTNIDLQGKDCMVILRALQDEGCTSQIVLLTVNTESQNFLDIIRFGVRGIVRMDMVLKLLIPCIRKVYDGGEWFDRDSLRQALGKMIQSTPETGTGVNLLSPHEVNIAHLVTDGYSNKEIARRINSTEGTVKAYLHRIYRKLEVRGRVNLANLIRKTSC